MLPQPIAIAITPPTVSGDQQPRGRGVALAAQLFPPLRNGGNRKLGCLLRDADRNPGFVVREVIGAVGNRLPPFGCGKSCVSTSMGFPVGQYSLRPFFLLPRL